MALKKRYYTLNGRIIAEKAPGSVRTDYMVDHLGSVIGTSNKDGTVNRSYRYKPYGADLANSGSGSDPKFRWVGCRGYRITNHAIPTHYVRARSLSALVAQWLSSEPLWIGASPYAYVRGLPVSVADPSGNQAAGPSIIEGKHRSVRITACGKTTFMIRWFLPKSRVGETGTIIQHVTIDAAWIKCDLSSPQVRHFEYLEAWGVLGSESKVVPGETDEFAFGGADDCTMGSVKWRGKVSFYRDYYYFHYQPPWRNAPPGHPAGILHIVDPIPANFFGPLGGPPQQPHTLDIQWNCCLRRPYLNAVAQWSGETMRDGQPGGPRNPDCKRPCLPFILSG